MDHREKVASFARAHAGCSAHVNQPLYIEAVVPVADRAPGRIEYYTGSTPPSTCALFADQCLAGAGIDHPPIEGRYVIGTAVADLENVDGGRALRLGTPDRPLRTGDIAIIDDGSGKDAHVIVLVGEPMASSEALAAGVYEVDTVEGGQLPDSSGVKAFTRTMTTSSGKLFCGHRFVVAWIDADALGIGDDAAHDTADPAHEPVDPTHPMSIIPIPAEAHFDSTPPPEDPDATIKPG